MEDLKYKVVIDEARLISGSSVPVTSDICTLGNITEKGQEFEINKYNTWDITKIQILNKTPDIQDDITEEYKEYAYNNIGEDVFNNYTYIAKAVKALDPNKDINFEPTLAFTTSKCNDFRYFLKDREETFNFVIPKEMTTRSAFLTAMANFGIYKKAKIINSDIQFSELSDEVPHIVQDSLTIPANKSSVSFYGSEIRNLILQGNTYITAYDAKIDKITNNSNREVNYYPLSYDNSEVIVENIEEASRIALIIGNQRMKVNNSVFTLVKAQAAGKNAHIKDSEIIIDASTAQSPTEIAATLENTIIRRNKNIDSSQAFLNILPGFKSDAKALAGIGTVSVQTSTDFEAITAAKLSFSEPSQPNLKFAIGNTISLPQNFEPADGFVGVYTGSTKPSIGTWYSVKEYFFKDFTSKEYVLPAQVIENGDTIRFTIPKVDLIEGANITDEKFSYLEEITGKINFECYGSWYPYGTNSSTLLNMDVKDNGDDVEFSLKVSSSYLSQLKSPSDSVQIKTFFRNNSVSVARTITIKVLDITEEISAHVE